MITTRRGAKLEADVHGMRADEAKRQLEFLISRAGRDVSEIVVIHGYSHGQALKNMVRGELRHPRIDCKLPSLNEGQTRILLKK